MILPPTAVSFFFFFNDTATTEIYTLSLHDALPISFSTDTPNLITDLVRTGGVSQNWVWWAFALTGMCTVFFYAKLWRRSAALTGIAFYELRYSGKPAAFLRGFRAIYLGVFFNVMIMASVNSSATKIAGVMLGWDRGTAVLIGGGVTGVGAAHPAVAGAVLI